MDKLKFLACSAPKFVNVPAQLRVTAELLPCSQLRKKMKFIMKLATLVAVAALSACQTPSILVKVNAPSAAQVSPEDLSTAKNLLMKQDLPLRSVSIIEKQVAQNKIPAQFAAQFVAMLGIEADADKVHYAGMTPWRSAALDTAGVQALDAVQEIVAAAKTHRVVIINESHWHQRHRAFAQLLAKELRKIGFTHLGFEALSPGTGAQVRLHGPAIGLGFYTMDPFLADFIRQATVMGYEVFDYEQRDDQQAAAGADRAAELEARERAEAENISAILKANPQAKIMLYVGGGHGMKTPSSGNLAMMALQLKQMTGVEILSINQTAPISIPAFNTPDYQAVEPLLAKNRSTVIRLKDGQWLAAPGYDFTVFHPRLPEIYGRAGWIEMEGYRKLHRVKLAPLSERTLLRARATPTMAGNIAFDQVVVAPSQSEAALFLPIGAYELFREFESGVTEKVGGVVVR